MAAGALSGLPGDAAILSGGGLRLTRSTSNKNRSVRSPLSAARAGGAPGWRLAPYPGYRVMR
ncbi:hypothetical protein PPF30_04660, partial [Klebsiella variicola]|uniref:hypothetical protein n=1 Tax=Klebsiella variicola TaxID=244366 RepID=UPI002FFA79AB